MRPTNTQLRRIEELAARLLTDRGADQVIRALLVIDGGLNRDDIKLDADPELVAALRPHTDRRIDETDGTDTPLPGILRAARHNLCLSQTVVAQRLGVSMASVGNWEAGRSVPQGRHLDDIGRVLGIPPRVLDVARGRAVAERSGT